jgi:hypothetical protein
VKPRRRRSEVKPVERGEGNLVWCARLLDFGQRREKDEEKKRA